MIQTIELTRIYQEDCTIGVINFGNKRCFSLELPWCNNERGISCIPEGLYECKKHVSPSNGDCISVIGVTDRDNIQIHKGNFVSDIEGCILVGDSLKDISGDGIIDVTNSKRTLKKLMSHLPDTFKLRIA